MRRCLAILLLASASTAAQPNAGDCALSDFVNTNEIVCVDPSTGQLTTLVAGVRVFASAAVCGRRPGYILGNTVGVTVQR